MNHSNSNSNSNSNNDNQLTQSQPQLQPQLHGQSQRQSENLTNDEIIKLKQNNYKTYIYKVLKQVHPEMSVSKEGMDVMNEFVHDTFILIMDEASRLCKMANKKTLTAREIQTAVALVLPGELHKHAMSEGTKAVCKYESSLR